MIKIHFVSDCMPNINIEIVFFPNIIEFYFIFFLFSSFRNKLQVLWSYHLNYLNSFFIPGILYCFIDIKSITNQNYCNNSKSEISYRLVILFVELAVNIRILFNNQHNIDLFSRSSSCYLATTKIT